MHIQELITISNHVAFRKDWIQGAGGNTSVKKEDGIMLIKASGKILKDIAKENAFVSVTINDILAELKMEAIDVGNSKDLEHLDAMLQKYCLPNEKKWKPSMETSFHCLYGKYVLHTHNVYANVFLCSSHFELLETCFDGNEKYSASILGDYYTPGAALSWHLYDTYRFQPEMPNVTFLPNHGVIYSHSKLEELLLMHDEVQQKLTSLLKFRESDYPDFTCSETSGSIEVNCAYLFEVWKKIPWQTVLTDLLFPDQAIYILDGELSDTDQESPIYINFLVNKLKSKKSMKATEGILEVLLAYFFIREQILEKGYEPLTINSEFVKLRSMQSEQYRKQQIQ